MKWAVILVRTLVGLAFVVFGLNGFLHFIEIPTPPTEQAKNFFAVMVPSHYLEVVKVLEVVGGALMLLGLFPLVGLLLITPISVNILLYDILLVQQPGLGYALVPMCLFLLWGYWNQVKGIFQPSPSIG